MFVHHSVVCRIQAYDEALANGFFDATACQTVAFHLNEIHRIEHTIPPSRINAILDELRSFPSPDRPINHQRTTFRPSNALEFPKDGVGIQCDINFSNELAIHNTHLLKCYSLCDPRVKPFVLFIKSWSKTRNINTPYHGTLSSYGYVLMALHYLMNVASPPIIPNLQLLHSERNIPPNQDLDTCSGYDIRFFRDEDTIRKLAAEGAFTTNKQHLGELLLGFFRYYGSDDPRRGMTYRWISSVLSLRTKGGILDKQAKGWTAAKTTFVDVPVTPTKTQLSPTDAAHPQPEEPASPTESPQQSGDQQKQAIRKEIRHRYLIAIEDPFELEHNVGRTVVHHGIVAIRDELRRAWRIIQTLGGERGQAMGKGVEEELLAKADKGESVIVTKTEEEGKQ